MRSRHRRRTTRSSTSRLTAACFYNTEPVAYRDIPTRVLEDVEFNKEEGEKPGVYLRAHRTVPWEIIAPVVEICGAQNIDVAMVTKPLEKNE